MLILLDRDGVINKDLPHGVRSLDEFVLIPGAAEAIRMFNQAHMKVALVTNQAVVGRKEISESQLQAIHTYMSALLAAENAHIDALFVCTDTTVEPNQRRKPAPGMLVEAMAHFHHSPEETIMIGDAVQDLQAAMSAGCRRVLVRTGKGENTLKEDLRPLQPIEVFDNLWQAADTLTCTV